MAPQHRRRRAAALGLAAAAAFGASTTAFVVPRADGCGRLQKGRFLGSGRFAGSASAEGALPTSAEQRFRTLRLTSDLEEILLRVPDMSACDRPQLAGGLLLARLGLNFMVLSRAAINAHTGPWKGWLLSGLPLAEFMLYLIVLASAFWALTYMKGLDPQLGYIRRNNLRWRRAAMGAGWLQWAAGFSTLKLLDGFRSAVPEMKAVYQEHFNADEGPEKPHRGVMKVLRVFAFELGKGVVGLAAFSAKLATFDGSLIHTLGLANQMIHITEVSSVEKSAVHSFVFTGQDAKWSLEEADALREFEGRLLKRCVRHTGNHITGVAAFAAVDAADFQRLVITEEEPDTPNVQ